MLEISNVKVYDLKESVVASGNAMRTEPVECTDEEFEKGIKRVTRLVHSSLSTDVHCHDNALTGIRVSFDVKYPQYWSMEFQRYHFADIVTSSSKMHRLCKMEVSKSCNKYVSQEIIEKFQEIVDRYNSAVNDLNLTSYAFFNNETKEVEFVKGHDNIVYALFMQMMSNCPMGLELFERVSTNYKQLQTIYYQRKNHRLKEDWGAFCKMIEELPYFNELIKGAQENDGKRID